MLSQQTLLPAPSCTNLLIVICPVALSQINILENSARFSTLSLPALTRRKLDQLQPTTLNRDNGLEVAVVYDVVRNRLGGKVYKQVNR